MRNSGTVTGRLIFTSSLVKIHFANGVIEEIEKIAGEGDYPYISPGFLDIQVNGYAGIDYSSEKISGNDLGEMVRLLRKSGTTRHLPTIITAPQERIVRNLKVMALALNDDPELEHAVSGFHIEGPYISGIDGPRGAHDPAYVRDPDFEEFLQWQEASGGRIKIVTLAPERKGALDFIEKVTRMGVIAALGHTAASPEIIHQAVKAGARLSTHLGNGSHAELPRLRNYLWEQLSDDSLFASIISDGFHLPSAVLKIFYRSKGMDKLILVSDVSPVGGLKPGDYQWDRTGVHVYGDGHVGLTNTPFLAGAGHLLDHDIAHFKKITGCSVSEAVKLCTVNPSRLLSMPETTYMLTKGLRTNLVLFRFKEDSTRLEIEQVIV